MAKFFNSTLFSLQRRKNRVACQEMEEEYKSVDYSGHAVKREAGPAAGKIPLKGLTDLSKILNGYYTNVFIEKREDTPKRDENKR